MSRFLQDLESPSGFNPRALTRIVSVPADAMSSPHDHLCTVETGLTHFSGGWMVATPGSGRRANPLNRERDSSPYLPDVLGRFEVTADIDCSEAGLRPDSLLFGLYGRTSTHRRTCDLTRVGLARRRATL